MRLPFYSITQELNDKNIARKILAGAIAIAVIFLNLPNDKEDFILQINKGLSWGLPETIFTSIICVVSSTIEKLNDDIKNPQLLRDDRLRYWTSNPFGDLDPNSFTFAPVDEEITNRAILQLTLRKTLEILNLPQSYSSLLAVIVAALIFAFQHEGYQLFKVPAGLIYGLLYEYFGLTASITAHMFHNFIIQILEASYLFFKDIIRIINLDDALNECHQPYKSLSNSDHPLSKFDEMKKDLKMIVFENRNLFHWAGLPPDDTYEILDKIEIMNEEQLNAEHQKHLQLNLQLRKKALDKLSNSFLYRLFPKQTIQNVTQDKKINSDEDEIRLYSYLSI